MSNLNEIEYKGYKTRVHYSHIDKVLYGKIEGILDLVSFESENVEDVEPNFKKAVDDYMSFCKELNKDKKRCINCNACHKVGENKYECWGVKHPFTITNIQNAYCTEY